MRCDPWITAYPADRIIAHRTWPLPDLLRALNAESVRRGLVTGHGHPLRFVEQAQCPSDVTYESWIASTGAVPTRDNLHDRYNAMIWMLCPVTKASLNGIQARAIAAHGDIGPRGPVRDMATLWDENLLVLVADEQSQELRHHLTAHAWQSLFMECRARWYRHWHPLVFGHALLEKLDKPFKSITAHCLVLPVATLHWSELDPLLAAQLGGYGHPSCFQPLPVMGIPGWHIANDDPDFYTDARVFRPPRRHSPRSCLDP